MDEGRKSYWWLFQFHQSVAGRRIKWKWPWNDLSCLLVYLSTFSLLPGWLHSLILMTWSKSIDSLRIPWTSYQDYQLLPLADNQDNPPHIKLMDIKLMEQQHLHHQILLYLHYWMEHPPRQKAAIWIICNFFLETLLHTFTFGEGRFTLWYFFSFTHSTSSLSLLFQLLIKGY